MESPGRVKHWFSKFSLVFRCPFFPIVLLYPNFMSPDFTQSFNRRHNRVGHVFQGRYKAILVQKETHLLELCRYIVLNPVRAKMVEKPGNWKWSSYYSTASEDVKPDWLTTDWILGQFAQNKKAARKSYRKIVESGVLEKTSPWDRLKGQMFFGSKNFIHAIKEGNKGIKEISKVQRYANRIKLKDLLQDIEK